MAAYPCSIEENGPPLVSPLAAERLAITTPQPDCSFMRALIKHIILALALTFASADAIAQSRAQFTIEQITSYPFPNELTASSSGSRIAWAFNERGQRNVWVAEDLSGRHAVSRATSPTTVRNSPASRLPPTENT